MIDEVEQLRAERDRYGSLVGTAYNADGVVRQGLEGAAAQQNIEQMRAEIRAVISFLADNNPFSTPAATPF